MKHIILSEIDGQVFIKSSALALVSSVEDDTVLFFWDCQSDMSFIDMKGVVYSPSEGTIVPLKGHRNVGIHTGHSPVFYPSYKVKWKNVAGYILRCADEKRPIRLNIQDSYPEYLGKEEIPFPYLKGLWED